ncbi:MAG: universal stress protein [Arenicellales bacterium]|nr:universal stress protein [Arenicellales bacterium]
MENPNIQPILVPVDFSTESKEALLFANELSARERRPLVVLHVMHDNGSNGASYRREADGESLLPIHEIAERRMEDFINGICEEYADLDMLKSAKTIVVDGVPVTRIIEVAQQLKADHIVVGGNERGHLSRMFNGSVSVSLVKDSPVPITVVRSKGVD